MKPTSETASSATTLQSGRVPRNYSFAGHNAPGLCLARLAAERCALRRLDCVSSIAFQTWDSERLRRMRQLTDAHSMVGGPGPGRRTRTEAINWALVVILSSELQGYFRELHDESVEFLAQRVARGNQVYFTLVRNNLTANRGLDRVNPKPETLQSDFERLGVDLWTDIRAQVQSGARWHQQLTRLNRARNAVAHHEPAKLATLAREGYPLTLRTVESWRTACEGVARNADKVVGVRLHRMTGVRAW